MTVNLPEWTLDYLYYFGIFALATLSVTCGLSYCFRKAKLHKEKAKAKERNERETYLRGLLPEPWYALYTQMRYLRYFNVRLTRLEQFCLAILESETTLSKRGAPLLSADAIYELIELVDGGSSDLHNVKQAGEVLCPFIKDVKVATDGYTFNSSKPRPTPAYVKLQEAVRDSRTA